MSQLPDDPTTGSLVWRLAMKWRTAVDRELSPLGLTHAQYMLLASLYGLSRSGARPSQRELADFAGLEPIYVSKITRTLEHSGLLVRDAHPADSRARCLILTDHGVDTARRAVALVHALQEDLTAPIGGTDHRRTREFRRTLRILLDPPPVPHRGDQDPEIAEIERKAHSHD